MTTEPSGIRKKLHEIIFEAETLEGKAFDVALIDDSAVAILAKGVNPLFDSANESPVPILLQNEPLQPTLQENCQRIGIDSHYILGKPFLRIAGTYRG